MQVLERLSDIERDFEQQAQPRLVRAPLMEQPALQRLPQRACPTQSNIRSGSALQMREEKLLISGIRRPE